MKKYDICIIGAGIIGVSIARELTKYNLSIIVLEANKRVGLETSSGNSGVIHGGFDPTPNKLNAKLNILGKTRYEDWIKEMDFPHKRINSLVVGFNDEEMQHINMLYARGLENGLAKSELKVISAPELFQQEPYVSREAKGALLCNSSIIVDSLELTKTLMRNALKNGAEIQFEAKVNKITKSNNIHIIETNHGDRYFSHTIINAAGHYADVISKMAGHDEFTLTSRRGEYRVLEKTENTIVNSVIFMVPSIHGKGVIVAPTMDGHILVGPTAQEGIPKDETRLITKEQFDTIAAIGTKLIPTINMNKTVSIFSGSRPIEVSTDDFWIKPTKKDKTFINVAGIKSPGLSSAPAIADYVINIIGESTTLVKKSKWLPQEKQLIF